MHPKQLKTLIKKEWLEMVKNKVTLTTLVVFPLIFSILLPLVFIIVATTPEVTQTIDGIDAFLAVLPSSLTPDYLPASNHAMYAIANFVPLPLLVMVPVMISNVIASTAFIGEKEQHTLEGLIYTPITFKELILAKGLAAFIPAMILAWIGILIYQIVFTAMEWWLLQQFVLLSWNWLLLAFVICPLITFLSILLVFMMSPILKTAKAAQSMAVIIIFPVIALLISQVNGLLIFSMPAVIVGSLLLLLIDIALFLAVVKRFDVEKYLLG